MAKKLTIDIETRVTRTREARAEIEKALSSVKADLKIRVDPKDADDKFAHLNSLVKGAEQAVVNYRKEIKATESAFVRAAARGGDHYTANMLQVDEMKARRKQATAFMKETKALYEQVFLETYGKAIDLVVDTGTAKTAVEELRARIVSLRESGTNAFSANVFRGKITGDLERQLDEVQSRADALKESLSHATEGMDVSSFKVELDELVARATELRRILAIDTVRDFYRQSGLHIGNDFGSIPVRHGGKDSDIDRAQRASILAHIIRPIFEQNDVYKRLEEQNADTAEYSKKLLTYWQKRGEVVEPGGDWGMMQDLLGPLAGGTPGAQPWQPFFAQMSEEWQRHQDEMADADRKRNGLPPADSAAAGYRNLRAQSRDIALHFGGGNRTVVDESTGEEVEDESAARKESTKTIRNWSRIVQAGLGTVLMTDYALRKLGNNSRIVSTFYGAYGKVFGAIIDTALVPFLPALRTVLSAMSGVLKMLRDTHGALGVFLRGLTLFAFTGLPLITTGLMAKGILPLLLQKLVTATLGKRAADFLFQNTTRGQLAAIQATLGSILAATTAGAGGGALDTATDIGMMAALGGRFGWLKKIPGLGRLFGGAGGTLTKAYRWLPKSVPIGAEGAGALAKIRNVLGGLKGAANLGRLASIGRVVPFVASSLSWLGGALASVASAVVSIPGLIGAAIGGVVVAAMYFTGILTAIADAGQGVRDWLHDVLGWSREGGLSGAVPAVKPVWESDKTYEAVKGVNDGTITNEQQFGNAIKPTHFAQGGSVTQTGLALIHTGETVVPAGRQPLAGAAGSNIGALTGAAAAISKDAAAYTSAGQAADQYSLKTLRVISILKMLSVWLFRAQALLLSLSRPWIIPLSIVTLGITAGFEAVTTTLTNLWNWITSHVSTAGEVVWTVIVTAAALVTKIGWELATEAWNWFTSFVSSALTIGWSVALSASLALVKIGWELGTEAWNWFSSFVSQASTIAWSVALSAALTLTKIGWEIVQTSWASLISFVSTNTKLTWAVAILAAVTLVGFSMATLTKAWSSINEFIAMAGRIGWTVAVSTAFSWALDVVSAVSSFTESMLDMAEWVKYRTLQVIVDTVLQPGSTSSNLVPGGATASGGGYVPGQIGQTSGGASSMSDDAARAYYFGGAGQYVPPVVDLSNAPADHYGSQFSQRSTATAQSPIGAVQPSSPFPGMSLVGISPTGSYEPTGGAYTPGAVPFGSPQLSVPRIPRPVVAPAPVAQPVAPTRYNYGTVGSVILGGGTTSPVGAYDIGSAFPQFPGGAGSYYQQPETVQSGLLPNPYGKYGYNTDPIIGSPMQTTGGSTGGLRTAAGTGVGIVAGLGAGAVVYDPNNPYSIMSMAGLGGAAGGGYQPPMIPGAVTAMAVGGDVLSDGAAIIHKGETIVPADVKTPYGNGGGASGGGDGMTIVLNNPVFQFTGKDEKQMFDNFMRRMKQEGGRLK